MVTLLIVTSTPADEKLTAKTSDKVEKLNTSLVPAPRLIFIVVGILVVSVMFNLLPNELVPKTIDLVASALSINLLLFALLNTLT